MMPLSYPEVAALHNKGAPFSAEEYRQLVFSATQDSILARLLALYPPINPTNPHPFKTKYARARALFERAEQREGVPTNVHDPIFGDMRQQIKTWLGRVVADTALTSSKSLVDTLLEVFKDQVEDKAELSSEERAQREDRRAFFNYLQGSYAAGATGERSLKQVLAYCACQDTSEQRKNAYQVLFTSLEQARTAYEGELTPYIRADHRLSGGQDRTWSCMPGVEERILDGCFPWGEEVIKAQVALSAHGATPEHTLQHLIFPFITQQAHGLVPSKLLYSMYVYAIAGRFELNLSGAPEGNLAAAFSEKEEQIESLEESALITLLRNYYPQISVEHWQLLLSIQKKEDLEARLLYGTGDLFEQDKQKISSELSLHQQGLLAVELQAARARPGYLQPTIFHRYYGEPTETLLRPIQEQVLARITSVLYGYDYFAQLSAPCQDEIMERVVRDCLGETQGQERAQKNLLIWLAQRGYKRSLQIYFTLKDKSFNELVVLFQYGDNNPLINVELIALCTPAPYDSTVRQAGAHVGAVARGLCVLAAAQLLNDANRQALLAAGAHAWSVALGLCTLADAQLLNDTNRQALIAAGEYAGAVADGLSILERAQLLKATNCQALIAAKEHAPKIAREIQDFYDWHSRVARNRAAITAGIIFVVCITGLITPLSVLASLAIAVILGIGVLRIYKMRLEKILLPSAIKLACEEYQQSQRQLLEEERDSFILGKESAQNSLPGYIHYCRSFVQPKAYTWKWYEGFVQDSREQSRDRVRGFW